MPSILRHLFLLALALTFAPAQGQIAQTKNDFEDKFRQLDESWPTPGDPQRHRCTRACLLAAASGLRYRRAPP